MKCLQVLSLIIILAFSSAILAQEKETEKPKEVEKVKEIEKRKTTNPHGFIVQFWSHSHRGKIPLNPVPDVTDVELILDDTVKDDSNGLCFPDKFPGIEVITKSNNPNNDELTYNYTISGGKIVGKGENVIWDLSGVKPGTYTITAAVDDGCGFCGKTMTRIVIVKE